MTAQTPATEAGRRLLAMDNFDTAALDDAAVVTIVLAIEAEARALGDEYKEATDAAMNYGQGRADALREAADAVRKKLPNGYHRDAVLAILDPQP